MKQNSEVEKVLKNESLSKSKKMLALYSLKLSIKEISELMSVRYNFVYNVVSNFCRINDVELTTNKKEVTKKDEIIKMYQEGKSNKEISITLKTNYNYVFNTLKQFKNEQKESV